MLTSLSFAANWGGSCHINLGTGDHPLFRSVGAIDISELARRYHQLNWPDTPVFDFNLKTVSVEQIKEVCGTVDLIINTCPCQQLSNANASSKASPYGDLNAMLLRTIEMLPHLAPYGGMILENVPGILSKRMRIFYSMLTQKFDALKDYVWIDTNSLRFKSQSERVAGISTPYDFMVKLHSKKKAKAVPRTLNSLDFNSAQDRDRYIAILIHRERLNGKILTLPKPTTIDYEPLRIKNIAPEIEFLCTGYTDEFGKHTKVVRSRENFCYTATATANLWDQDNRPISIRRLLDFCGYDQSWVYDHHPKAYLSMFHLAGESVMPPFARALGDHLYKLLS